MLLYLLSCEYYYRKNPPFGTTAHVHIIHIHITAPSSKWELSAATMILKIGTKHLKGMILAQVAKMTTKIHLMSNKKKSTHMTKHLWPA